MLRGQEGIDQYFLPPLALNKEGLEIVSQKFRKYCDEHHIYPILRGLNEKMKNYIMKECEHCFESVSYTHLRAHETVLDLVCRLLLEKKKKITDTV